MKRMFLGGILMIVMILSMAGCGGGKKVTSKTNLNSGNTAESAAISESADKEASSHGNPTLREVHVTTVSELLKAIDSSTRVVLAPGRYDLSNWIMYEFDGELPDHIMMDWDSSINIENVENLVLEAENPAEETMILVTNDEIPVLGFNNCRKVQMNGLTLGHDVAPNTCYGSVLKLEDCVGTELWQMNLYGCGTYGVEAYGGDLKVYDSLIHNCSQGGVYIMLCNLAEFTDTVFQKCGKYTILESSGSKLHFVGCEFLENEGQLLPDPDSYDHDSTFIFERCNLGDFEQSVADSPLAIVREES